MLKIALIVIFVLAIISGALSYKGDDGDGKYSIVLELSKFQEALKDLTSSTTNKVKESETFKEIQETLAPGANTELDSTKK